MNSETMQQSTREAVKKKFGRKRLLTSKAVPHYPKSVEREYIRIMDTCTKLLNKTVAANIPKIRRLLEPREMNADDADEKREADKEGHVGRPNFHEVERFNREMEHIIGDMSKEFRDNLGTFKLYEKLKQLSEQTKKLSVAEWKRVVRRTIGIDIMEDYYNGVKFQQLFDKWVADNVGLIKTISQETLGNMSSIVKSGYLFGATNKTIAKKIQEAYDVSKYRAKFIARDQTAKLNAQVTQEQQRDAGVNEYVWRTAGNIGTFPNSGRVRKGHAKLNNKRFRYSEPPIVDERTGRRANPGEDYNCRCVALPVFDIDTIVLPWQENSVKGG